ncbi:MAG: dienelactone hydrolase family protein [Bryobacterales bacterium]|nr:dienelactone hydrolase family protein [Bryobacterales bacterium]
MAIQTRQLDYKDGSQTLCGQLAWDPSSDGPSPGVLVVHTWAGCGEFERGKAIDLARLGYVALAVDMYGDGVVGGGPEENARLMAPLLEDRALLQRRVLRALEALKSLQRVDASRTAAIGFCFGGLCVLDLARTGAECQGAVSFHGLLDPPGNLEGVRIRASVLVLHGWDDPMALPESVAALGAELTVGGADWQVHAYGGTMHAFTNPKASSPENGTVYSARADSRSWEAMRDFLGEALGTARRAPLPA